MSKRRGLAGSQERRRIEGLRILARIIARHYLSHPELYPGPVDGPAPSGDGHIAGDGEAGSEDGQHGP